MKTKAIIITFGLFLIIRPGEASSLPKECKQSSSVEKMNAAFDHNINADHLYLESATCSKKSLKRTRIVFKDEKGSGKEWTSQWEEQSGEMFLDMFLRVPPITYVGFIGQNGTKFKRQFLIIKDKSVHVLSAEGAIESRFHGFLSGGQDYIMGHFNAERNFILESSINPTLFDGKPLPMKKDQKCTKRSGYVDQFVFIPDTGKFKANSGHCRFFNK